MRYLAVLALAVSGCASNWVHETKGPRELKADRYECNRDAIGTAGGLLAIALINECMEAKGWERD